MKFIVTIFALMVSLFTLKVSADTDQYFLLNDVGASAETVRLGGVEGFSSLSHSIFENPASLYKVQRFSSSIFTTQFMNEVTYYNMSMGMRMPRGILAAGVMGTSISGVPHTVEVEVADNKTEFEADSYFSYTTLMGKLAYQYSLSELIHMGASFSYFYTSFGSSVIGKGYNGDLGMVLDGGDLVFSMAVKNVIPSLEVKYTDTTESVLPNNSSSGQKEPLPLQTLYGLKYQREHLGFYGQLKTVGNGRGVLKSGSVEFIPPLFSFIQFSAGYKQYMIGAQAIEGELEENKKYGANTFGVGLDLYGVSFDYAYEKISKSERKDYLKGFDQKHYFSVALSF